MRVALFADIHLNGESYGKTIEAAKEARENLLANNIETVCFCGDFYDRNNLSDANHISELIDAGIRFLDVFSSFKTLHVIGNHDRPNDNVLSVIESIAPRNSFKDLPGIYRLNWQYKKVTDEIMNNIINEIKERKSRLLIGHAATFGAILRDGENHEKYSDWTFPCEFWEEIESLGCIVKLGHFHKKQPYYVGAFSQNNFAEESNPQGFEILDLESGETEWIENTVSTKRKTLYVGEWDEAEIFKKADEILNNVDGVKYRFHFGDSIPSTHVLKYLADRRISYKVKPPKINRQQRVEDLPAGILASYHELFEVYLHSRTDLSNEEKKYMMNRFSSSI